ncbi:MAG TPA: hypothetical protein ENG66_06515 [Thermococcus sp.]|nr:MAG: hypothetical protein DRP04_03455 [Archaeoglobales archaeon]HDH45023.1 hypothetical protein [Thermococcus sp.]
MISRIISREKGKAEEGREEEGEIPQEFVALVAKKFFELYGDEITKALNSKIMQLLYPIRERLDELEKDVRYLKETSDEKIKEFLRATLDVHTESVAERSARKAIEMVGMDKLEKIDETLNSVREMQTEIVETVEKASNVLRGMEDSTERLCKKLEGVVASVGQVVDSLGKTIEDFKSKVESATDEAVKNIKANVVVDKPLIESVLESTVSRIVASKLNKFIEDLQGLQNRTEALSREIRDLRRLKEDVNVVINKLDKLEEEIRFKAVVPETEVKEEKEIKERFEEVKKEGDKHVIDIMED